MALTPLFAVLSACLSFYLSGCLSPRLSHWLSSMLTSSPISISQPRCFSSSPSPSLRLILCSLFRRSFVRRLMKMLSLLFLPHQQLQTPTSLRSDRISSARLRNGSSTTQLFSSQIIIQKDFLTSTNLRKGSGSQD